MSRLPFYTVILIATAILIWNFSFYRGFYEVHAAGAARPGTDVLAARHVPTQGPDAPVSIHQGDDAAEAGARGAGNGASATDLDRPDSEAGGRETVEGPVEARGAQDPIDAHETLNYDDGSKRAEGTRRDGRRHGKWVEYFPGTGTVLSEGYYENDLREGLWKYFYENGQIQHEGSYREGWRDQHWESFHESGDPMRRGSFEANERVGEWLQWYSNGQIMEHGQYEKGRREGRWEFYDFSGGVDRRTGHYERGRRVR